MSLTKLINLRRYSQKACPPPSIYGSKNAVVTIIECTCTLSKHLAFLLKQSPYLHELRLYTENEADLCTITDDLNMIDTRPRVCLFCGTDLKEAITGAHVVVYPGHRPVKPFRTIPHMFKKNAESVRNIAMYMSEFNPYAVFLMGVPPIEAMVPLVSEEYKKCNVYDYRKIIGIVSTYQMISNVGIGHVNNVDPTTILCPIIGGTSMDTVVSILSQSKPCAKIQPKDCNFMHERIIHAEEEVLRLKTEEECQPSFWMAPSVSIARFTNTVLRALQGDDSCVECAFIAQTGHIGKFLPYMTSIVRLGTHGITSSHMPRISPNEAHILKTVAPTIGESIRMGTEYILGRSPQYKTPQSTEGKNSDIMAKIQN